MRFLINAILSPAVAVAIASKFPGSCHVNQLGLSRASDEQIWEHAKGSGFCILSKDGDFHQRSFVRGHPPKVVWLRLGNASTRQAIDVLLANADVISAFGADEAASLFVLS